MGDVVMFPDAALCLGMAHAFDHGIVVFGVGNDYAIRELRSQR